MCDGPHHFDCRNKASLWAMLIWIAAIVAVICLYGCTPPYNKEVWDPPVGVAEDAVQDSGAFSSGNWPSDDWWSRFEDPQLGALIQMGLSQNPRIDIAAAQAQIAAADAVIARAAFFPTVDFKGDITRIRYSKNGIFGVLPPTPGFTFPFSNTQYEFSLNFAYEIDWWGKNRDILSAQIGLFQARLAEISQARLIVGIAIAREYFLWQMQKERLKIAERRVALLEELLNLTRMRSQQNIASQIPVNAIEYEYYNTKDWKTGIAQQAELDLNALRALIGGDFNEIIEGYGFSDALWNPFPLPENLELDLISRRADITAQLWRVEAAAKDVSVAKKEFLPNLNLMAYVGLQTLHPGKWLHNKSKYGQGGPALNLPLFEGGALQGNLEGSVGEYALAVAQYEDLLIRAVQEVIDGITDIRFWDIRNRELTTGVESLGSSFALAQDRLKHNINSRLDVLRAEITWLAARDFLVQGYASSLISQLNLIKALGGGYNCNGRTDES